MSEDNMQNDDLNQPKDIDNLDNLSAANPLGNIPDDGVSPDDAATNSDSYAVDNNTASNYNFDKIEGEPVNEVKIDPEMHNSEPVTVRPVEFTPFDSYTPTNTDTNKNLELLMDIKLELTVELGRCHLPVKKVLELTRGSIIELDKVAGESVELYANGKHVANGEVVVIEDNFGLRITSITDPEERIKSL